MEEMSPREHTAGQRGRVMFSGPARVFGGFLEFIRERGVAGFAIGFILGGAAQKLVQSFTDGIVNPFVGLFLARIDTLPQYTIGSFKVGEFLSSLINFLILCLVVYFIFRMLHLEKLDKKS